MILKIAIIITFSALLCSDLNAQSNSVLGSINCGGNQATCNQSSLNKYSGAVRCTCSAACLAPSCTYPDVASTRGVSWGNYVAGGAACLFELSGTATGGTQSTANPSTATAVYTQVTLSGLYLAVARTSKQVVDCFEDTIQNDNLILGFCR